MFLIHTFPADGQSPDISQREQSGLRAEQRRRPCQISQWLNKVHSSFGTSFIRACSIFAGSVSPVSPNLRESRATCVSTTTPTLMLKALPSTTFAVLRPTPPSSISSSIVPGTLPPCLSTSAWPQALMLLALFLS